MGLLLLALAVVRPGLAAAAAPPTLQGRVVVGSVPVPGERGRHG